MRLPGSRDCGDLLMFEEVRRRLHLGAPVIEGSETIRVDDVIGTVGRGGDFDGCFRPREPNLATRIREIRTRNPNAFNEPIDVIRVDRAYFVADGHKRVSIAKETGVEFIDARVSRAPSIYEVAPGVDADSIDRTSREQQFREETGLMAAVPGARFAVSETVGYPELQEALESYAYELSQRLGRLLSREEGAALWYECVYRPTVTAAQEARLPELLSVWTEADLFLALHKQSRQLWGTECRPAQDEADHLVAKVVDKLQPDPSAIGKLVQRARRRRQPELLPQRQS
jgi:ParB-like nuclease family protein